MKLTEQIKQSLKSRSNAAALLQSVDPSLDESPIRIEMLINACRPAEIEHFFERIRHCCEWLLLEGDPLDDEDTFHEYISVILPGSDENACREIKARCKHLTLSGRTLLQALFSEYARRKQQSVDDGLILAHLGQDELKVKIFRDLRAGDVTSSRALHDALWIGEALKVFETRQSNTTREPKGINVFRLKENEDKIKSYLGQLQIIRSGLIVTKRLFIAEGGDPTPECNDFYEKVLDDLTRFFATIKLTDGFIAPLHLITGLLSRFDDDWQVLIDDFEHNLKQVKEEKERRYRQLQLFTYDCWLLWGPSILLPGPPDKISPARFPRAAMQYGFGDENNSIPVWFPDNMQDQFQRLMAKLTTAACPASKCSLLGHLAMKTPRMNGDLPVFQHTVTRDPAKPILDPELVLQFAGEKSEGINRFEPNHYYSAYIWAAFVACTQDGENLLPIYPSAGECPWSGIVPVFVHGNIADPETYAACKAQLAYKSLATFDAMSPNGSLEDMLPEIRLRHNKIQFIYCCAFDDNGSDPEPPNTSIQSMIAHLLAYRFMHLQGMVRIVPPRERPMGFEATSLPEIVKKQIGDRA